MVIKVTSTKLMPYHKHIKYWVCQERREAWKGELEVDRSPRNAWKVARKVLEQQNSTTFNQEENKNNI